MATERLQKLISAAGLASRRRAEALILEGRVTVNGEVVSSLGQRADRTADRILVDGKELPRPDFVYLALHKPVGVVSSVSDPHADRVVVELLGDDVRERVYPAGRLDLDSEGLMILTNDGELMNAMTRPASGIDKVYRVDVQGRPGAVARRRLEQGMELAGRRLLPCRIEPLPGAPEGRSRWRVTLQEGKKNQIRRMFKRAGHPVTRLVRVRIGPVRLGRLAAGDYRPLAAAEVAALRRGAGLAARGSRS